MSGHDGSAAVRVPGLRVQHRLGRGRVGAVWAALDLGTGETVAVEVVPPGAGAGVRPDGAGWVSRELAAVRRLRHPHLLGLRRVVDLPGGGRALVTDHAEAGSLAALLARRGGLDAGEVTTLLVPLAEALDAVRAAGLVHGDVAAANVLLTSDGRPLLAGLGVPALTGVGSGPSEGGAEAGAEADLRALVRLGLGCLRVPEVLAAADDHPLVRLRGVLLAHGLDGEAGDQPGRALASAVYAAVPPQPIMLAGMPRDATAGVPLPPPLLPDSGIAEPTVRARRAPGPAIATTAGGPFPRQGRRAPAPPTGRPHRPRLVLGGAALLVAGTLTAAWLGAAALRSPAVGGGDGARAVAGGAASGPEAAVHDLARARDAALGAWDDAALRRVDVEGSPALAADRAVLARLRALGQRPVGEPSVVLGTRLVAWRDGAAVVEVRTRVTEHVRSDGTGRPVATVGAGPARTVRLVLQPAPGSGGWRVWAVEAI